MIVSYGIILFSVIKGKIYFLLYKRRDSFEYMDFIRGKYNCEQDIRKLISKMTRSERERIINYSFDELWHDLWISHKSAIYRNGYERAKNKYLQFFTLINKYIKTVVSTRNKKESLWGFPKGKKIGNESDFECAKREFYEETRLSIEITPVFSKTYTEIFKGSNGKDYKTIFFVAESLKMENAKKIITPNGIRDNAVSDEASEVKWMDYDEATKNLNKRRGNLLTAIYLNIIAREISK